MKKSSRSKNSRTRKVVRVRSKGTDALLVPTSGRGFWGKDQQMVVMLSAGIIVLIVFGMYLSGWF